MQPLAIRATGMITSVGLDAPSSCAAMRCAIDGFAETRFRDRGGEWIIGSAVPLDLPSRDRERMLHMAASVVAECLTELPGGVTSQIPLLLCLAEENRPGRIQGLDQTLVQEVSLRLDVPLHPASAAITHGRVGGVEAIRWAGEFIDQGCPYCLVAGVDTFLVGETLAIFEAKRRLRTSQNSDGFIPGEAGAAVLLGPAGDHPPNQIRCLGIGFGREQATVNSEEPLRADGLAAALRAALADAGCTYDDVDYRLTDASGEQYAFKEAALAIARTMKKVKAEFDIWHPADCIGEVGAAVVPTVLSLAQAAGDKGYAPGAGVLCHFGNDDGARAAMIVRHFNERNV